MSEPSLKAGLWVKAQIRLCDIRAIPAMVARHGDDDAGVIYLKLMRRDGCEVLVQARDNDGNRAWRRPLGEATVAESEADAYLTRQTDYDPDLWVLEIEDPHGGYEPDAPVL